jgi:NDP-sugar pyrophosphorylase family protein
MMILIPMAGEGRRFQEENYTVPKPLIDVAGKPMVVRAVGSLPDADKLVFVCRDNHINSYGLDAAIRKHFKNATIVPVKELTQGQASTCLLARKFMVPDQPLLVGACDNGMLYDLTKFDDLRNRYDALIFTFRDNPTVVEKPFHYGWVVVQEDGTTVERVSVKIPISNNPIRDHAIVGAFWFRKSSIFLHAADRMIHMNRKINNEFYVDECMNDVVGAGLKVGVMEIDSYIGWGTPKDLKTYLYWNAFFSHTEFLKQ